MRLIPRVAARAAAAVFAFSLLPSLGPGTAEGSTVLYRTDAELVALSERVVHGRVLRQRSERPTEDGSIFTVTTLAVLEDLTGRVGDVVEVWELGGVHQGEFMYVGGAVHYSPGTEVVVCLERGPRGLRSVAMGFSKFDVVTSGPTTGVLIRNLSDTMVVGGRPAVSERRTLREFRELAESITGRKARSVRRDLALETESPLEVSAGFTTLSDLRWLEADSGVPIHWFRNTTASSPISPSDETADIFVALQAWTDPPSGSIRLQYDGTTSQGAAKGPWSGLSSTGTGVITYEDPNDEISGGTLAIGGGSGFSGGGGTFNGRTWNRFSRGYVIFQNAADLPFSFKQSPNFRRVLQHEIGHTIGLGHSSGGSSNIMYESCCSTNTPTPPALGPDDLAGLEFIYPVTMAGCTFSLSPSGRALSNAAQSDTFSVTTQPGCSWSASPSTNWLGVVSQSVASGSGTLTYSVSANGGPVRSGSLAVGGQTFSVTQASGPISLTSVSPSSGPSTGGTSITLTGNNFATSGGTPAVHIGANAAVSVFVASPTTITAVTPPGAVGARTVTVTNPNGDVATRVDGFTYTCAFSFSPASATVPIAGSTGNTFNVSTAPGCSWTAVSAASWLTVTGGSANGNGTVTYSAAALPGSLRGRVGTITVGGEAFNVVQGTPPTLGLDKTTLHFGAATTGAMFTSSTLPQSVQLTQSHPGVVTWTATSNTPWLTVSPASGSGPATLSIGVRFHGAAPVGTTATGSISLTISGAANNPGPITVNLRTYQGPTSPPSGVFETPLNDAAGVTGSIPVTGWALDDLEVSRVRILRDPVAGEGAGQVFIANGVFVDGARTDLLSPFPNTPRNTRGGWGYLLLTNFLPNAGNGTFTLHAYADDVDGHTTLLGSKTITVTNSSATLPFGAIDTPGQGETISGSSYNNFGWVLAPNPRRADPPGGGTVTVYIDGVAVGNPSGWTSRPDLTALFPGYAGLGTAAGVFTFNPSLLSAGVHTIAWLVTDNTGGAEGIGSRYFTVNGGVTGATSAALSAGAEASVSAAGAAAMSSPSWVEDVAAARLNDAPITGRRGFDLSTPFRRLAVDQGGRSVIDGEELDRFELKLGIESLGTLKAFVRANDELLPLPIGSRLDESTNTFTWQPGVGFVGPYDLVFVRSENGRAVARQEVRFNLHPKGSNRVGPQVTIDTPATEEQFEAGEEILIAGWAVDLDDSVGTGISAVHAWAYPVHGAGHGTPIFMGLADYGGHRPDVGVMFGERFARGAYDLVSPGLPPGTYDVAVFAWSTARHAFVPARVVRVTVR